tara:strand:+ start:172 stop:912 length:741 start_codon:yes stop_codon:yes gene_type:complete
MTNLKELPFSTLQFYSTATYPCSYLENHIARSEVATPSQMINADVYSRLVKSGFRRSGIFTYRPRCDSCNACTPLRLDVKKFKPNRNQRRAWKKHNNLKVLVTGLTYQKDHYELYQKYQSQRHAGGGMDHDSRDQYAQFLLQTNVNTRLVEFRDSKDKLKIVSIIDILDDGFSSVYTFFDPDEQKSSFGTYNILWQIDQTLQIDMSYLYLGYWIEKSKKMNYKINFNSLEIYNKGKWNKLNKDNIL